MMITFRAGARAWEIRPAVVNFIAVLMV